MANSRARAIVDVGSVIADTYTIEALIGQGGMGSVFLASHTRLPGKRVAIKLLHVELHAEDVIARFRREAHIAAQLDHPNIVRVDDYNVTEDGTPYLVLEYLEGESLAERLKHGPLPIEKVESILRMVGSAVAAAHNLGIVHRDLKPQNIFLITTEVEGALVDVAKVLDFGISKIRGGQTVKTQESTLLGTPQYMAPEQATGQHANVDERTDVFALGSIVYEMLAGRPAFEAENIPAVVFQVVYEQPPPLASVAPGTPPRAIAAVERAMAKQSDDRFATVSDFVEALTGRPLVQRSSMISLPPRDATRPTTGKRTGQAAFANTIDSGNVDKAVATGVAPLPPPPVVSPQAETMVSQAHNERSPTAPPVAPPRPKGLVIGLAIVAALAIGIAVFFATRKSSTATPDAAIALATPDAAVALATPDAAVAIAIDAAIPDAGSMIADAAVAVVAIDAGPKKRPTNDASGGALKTNPRDEGDPELWAAIDKGEAAYRSNDTDLAMRFANTVINRSDATAYQESLAYVLRGAIHCKVNNNIGLAQGDMRGIRVPALKAVLRKRCLDDAKLELP